ncbi:MAG: L-aspartate oxidase [Elusimicrobiales bacterium]|nr:L-aspartate oxidase [Elusimicrobiales bacterium]
MKLNKIYKSDFLIIGSGIGGLLCAIKLAKIGKVNLVTKDKINVSNSWYAQGGIAAAVGCDDSFESHLKDTLKAGDGLSNEEVATKIITSAPLVIKELTKLGINFNKNKKGFDLGLEGGHSKRRILHYYDFTGRKIIEILVKHVKNNKNINVFEYHTAIDLILKYHPKFTKPFKNEVFGAYVFNGKNGDIYSFLASKVILATGGGGKTYLYTSNPHTATGDGFAIGYKAGLNIVNMEFIQFHPTCLYHHIAQNFLISEALRGEGAVLRLKNGKLFMHKYSPMKELAPRDIVARAIANELKRTGDDYVYLDISFKPSSFIRKRFPYIYKTCLSFGIDITKQPIPVVPAAHFFCGGIESEFDGKTFLKNFFVCGEVAHTGFHGANRLASNSLLEASVMAIKIVENLKNERIIIPQKYEKHYLWDYQKTVYSQEDVIIKQNWDEIRLLTTNYAGIVRNNDRLKKASKKLNLIIDEVLYYYKKYRPNKDFIELRNIALVSKMIIESSLRRHESRGLYYNENYPQKLKKAKNTVINRYMFD